MPLVARRDAALVGRVSAVVNHRYNQHWNERVGQLIHFEALAEQDEAVAAMLEEASQWLLSRGMKAARSGFAAFLDYPYAIDNYGELPSFLLRGNPDYYHRYFKNAGFATEKAMVDYTAALTPEILARYQHICDSAQAAGVSIRSWRDYGFAAAVDAWTEVTNAAFERHWGWNPVTLGESRPMLIPLGETAVADLSMIACADGRPIGAVFSVPGFQRFAGPGSSGRADRARTGRRHARRIDQYRRDRPGALARRGAREALRDRSSRWRSGGCVTRAIRWCLTTTGRRGGPPSASALASPGTSLRTGASFSRLRNARLRDRRLRRYKLKSAAVA